MHVTTPAEEMLVGIVAAEGIACGEESAFLALARIDTWVMVTRAEADADATASSPAE